MDAGKQRAMVRKSTAVCKKQGGTLASAFKMGPKVAPKRKNNAKDDHPSKKGTGPSVGDQQQKSPPPIRHGVGKGLMTGKGHVILGSIQRLVTHKDYAVEKVNSIIKEMLGPL